ncbi:MAG: N-acetylmuramoyl-L-alanine amidase [Elusimicrobia bacterium]|nr:N-acetylmuramoyl-L-alanine amidase [Elusimicrobiota bacterium]
MGLVLDPVPALAQVAALPPGPPIVIDAGHGGRDLGAVANGLKEKDIVLSIAERLKAALEESGRGRGILLRDQDEYVPLDERVAKSVAVDGEEFISIHVNQVRSKRSRGISVFVFGKNHNRWARGGRRLRGLTPLPPPSRQAMAASTRLAQALVRSLRGEGLEVEPVRRSRYYVLKNPRLPSVLVELGFLSNPAEAELLKDPGYQDRLARSLAEGLVEYSEQARRAGRSVVTGR